MDMKSIIREKEIWVFIFGLPHMIKNIYQTIRQRIDQLNYLESCAMMIQQTDYPVFDLYLEKSLVLTLEEITLEGLKEEGQDLGQDQGQGQDQGLGQDLCQDQDESVKNRDIISIV